MLRALSIAAAFSVLVTTGAAAQCPLEPGSVATSVVKKPVSIVYHYDRTTQEITRLSGTVPAGGGYRNIGLTVPKVNYRLSVQGSVAPAGGAWYCAVLTKGTVTLSVPNLDVYVTNEYRRGSCLHKAVLTHELKHVAILRDTLDELSETMAGALANAAMLAGIGTGRTRDEALGELKDRVQVKLKPLFGAWKAEYDRRSAALDQAESMVNESDLCPSFSNRGGMLQSPHPSTNGARR